MVRYKHTLSTATRFNEILGMFIRYGFEGLIEQESAQKARKWLLEQFGREIPEMESISAPERARLLLQELGPTFVKFGQMAASQKSSLPEDWVTELSLLQSDVPPVDAEQVEQVILESLGQTPEKLYGIFEPEALAAASIGQVHRAVLPDGTPVAVKVQRPNIRPQIEEDLAIMHQAAQLLESTSQIARDFGAVRAVDEFAVSLLEELSYRHEGRNTERLGQNISEFPHLRTARIFWDYSSEHVLTMEFITGVKPTETEPLQKAGIDSTALAKEFAKCMAQQILIDGFFHADPHPGNLTINLEAKELIFLDTGMMGILDKSERRELIQLMLAIYQRDAPALAKVCISLSTRELDISYRPLSHELERLLGGMLNVPLSESGGGKVFAELLQLLQEHGIQLPSGMVMAIKSLMQMLEVLVALHPQFTFAEVAQIVADLMVEYHTQSGAMKSFLEERMRRVQLLGPLVDDAVEAFLKQAQHGSMKVELRGLELDKEIQTIARIARYLTLALLLGGVTIGSSIAMGASSQHTWSFIPKLGGIGFVCSLVLSTWLLFQDARKPK